MAVWADVKLTQIEYGRLDPQFYRPEFIDKKRVLVGSGLPLRKLGALSEKIDVGFVGPMVHAYSDTGVLLLRSQNIAEFYIDPSKNPVLIDRDFHRILRKSEVFPGDILITRSGTAGNAAIVPEGFGEANSADIIIVRAKPDVSPWFLIAFLNSKYGRFQIDRQVSGGVQGHLNLTIAADILVPECDLRAVKSIESSIQSALELMDKSRTQYGAALTHLEEALGITSLTDSYARSYATSFAEAVASHRCDAQHFRPEFDGLLGTMVGAIGSDHVLPLFRVITFNQRGKQPAYVEGGPVAVVNSQHIGPQHIRFDELASTSRAVFDDDQRSRLMTNDVVVYSTGAYVGRTNIWLEDMPAVASNHVNILRVKPEYDAAYVTLVLNSKVGAMQTEKHGTGSTQVELYPGNLAKFMIPILKQKVQREIGDKVRASYAALKESKALLERAKLRVEQLIEQGATA